MCLHFVVMSRYERIVLKRPLKILWLFAVNSIHISQDFKPMLNLRKWWPKKLISDLSLLWLSDHDIIRHLWWFITWFSSGFSVLVVILTSFQQDSANDSKISLHMNSVSYFHLYIVAFDIRDILHWNLFTPAVFSVHKLSVAAMYISKQSDLVSISKCKVSSKKISRSLFDIPRQMEASYSLTILTLPECTEIEW